MLSGGLPLPVGKRVRDPAALSQLENGAAGVVQGLDLVALGLDPRLYGSFSGRGSRSQFNADAHLENLRHPPMIAASGLEPFWSCSVCT